MVRPSPVPLNPWAPEARKYLLKMRGTSSGAIPIPVSETWTCRNPSDISTLTQMVPRLGVNLTALPIRLAKTRPTCFESRMSVGIPSHISLRK